MAASRSIAVQFMVRKSEGERHGSKGGSGGNEA